MAQRRNFGPRMDQDFMMLGTDDVGGGFGFDDAGMVGGDLNPGAPLEGPSGPSPQDPFGNGRDRPDAFYNLSPEEQQAIIDLQAGAIGGNPESGREINYWGSAVPTRPLSTPSQPTRMPDLPQGVSVEENIPEHDFRSDAPPMSMAPNPISASTSAQPMQTSTPPAGAGPTRRSVSSAAPALFDESGGARMFGNAGGLMAGGRGVVGADSGGPTPTEMMLAILRSLRGGG